MKLQSLMIAPFLEEMLPAPHDNGMDHEPELVEEAVLQQRPDQGSAAGDRDVLTLGGAPGRPLRGGWQYRSLH